MYREQASRHAPSFVCDLNFHATRSSAHRNDGPQQLFSNGGNGFYAGPTGRSGHRNGQPNSVPKYAVFRRLNSSYHLSDQYPDPLTIFVEISVKL